MENDIFMNNEEIIEISPERMNLKNFIETFKITSENKIIEIALKAKPKHKTFCEELTQEKLLNFNQEIEEVATRCLNKMIEEKNTAWIYDYLTYYFETYSYTDKEKDSLLNGLDKLVKSNFLYPFNSYLKTQSEQKYIECKNFIMHYMRQFWLYDISLNKELATIAALKNGFDFLFYSGGITKEYIEAVRYKMKQRKMANQSLNGELSEEEIINKWEKVKNELEPIKDVDYKIVFCALEIYKAKIYNEDFEKERMIEKLHYDFNCSMDSIRKYISKKSIMDIETRYNIPKLHNIIITKKEH